MRLFAQLSWYFRREWRRYLGAIALLIVIAILQGDLTVKRLKKVGGQWHLAAENKDYPSLPLVEGDCEVWGVVTHSIRRHCGR